MRKIPLSFARSLASLRKGEKLKFSEIKSKDFLAEFIDTGIISCTKITERRKLYQCIKPEELDRHLEVQYEIICIDSYINNFHKTNSSGQDSLMATKSSKTFRSGSLQGFFIRSYNTKITYNNKILCSNSPGIEYFVHDYSLLTISSDAVVVGIENPECFTKFQQLMPLFKYPKIVCVMRYLSKSPNTWLATIKNRYIHFGDFDLAGISIYINEYESIRDHYLCSFFIPQNIESLIDKFGSTDLYYQQENKYVNKLSTNDEKLQCLIKLIMKNKKSLEQERLLINH